MKYNPTIFKKRNSEDERTVDLSVIHNGICEYFNIPEDEKFSIFHNTRKRDIIIKRQWFQYFCVLLNPRQIVSYAYIGAYAKHETKYALDHSTIIHSFKTVSGWVDYYTIDRKIKTDIEKIIETLLTPKNKKPLTINCPETTFPLSIRESD